MAMSVSEANRTFCFCTFVQVSPLRCRHVVSQQGETALPSFDLNKKVGRKIKLQKYRRAVVLCVVDMADFDGSLPREALQELLPGLEEGEHGSPAGLGYRLVVAASKVDLLPPQATQARLQVKYGKGVFPVAQGLLLQMLAADYALSCRPQVNTQSATLNKAPMLQQNVMHAVVLGCLTL